MNNSDLMRAVQNLTAGDLAPGIPHLRPFGSDEVCDVRDEFLRWVSYDRGDHLTWQAAFNAWVGATGGRLGYLRVQRSRCPDCRGRRFSQRTLQVCLTCLNGRPMISTPAGFLEVHATAPVQRLLPRVGARVRVTGVMPDDPDPMPVGSEGTVTGVNDYERGKSDAVVQIMVDWDCGRTLILLSSDPFDVIG